MNTTIARNEAAAVDPTQARAEFFANLEILELTMVVPQAVPQPEIVNKY